MATPSIADSVGRVLGGRFRLLRFLDSGASAAVYAAEDIELGRTVAVKILRTDLASDRAFLSRFRAEARAAASLNHPNVVQIYDWGEDGGTPFIVSELLRGGSLAALLQSGRRLSVAQAAAVGRQVADGLAAAHSAGLIHRDVKPANLLFHLDGRVAVGDFGLVRALAAASITEQQGQRVGTARYSSPEQCAGRALGEGSDVYSLALVLIEAVTGEVPLLGDTIDGTALARSTNPLVAPPATGPLRSALEAAGRVDPGGRITAAELAAALAAVSASLPPPAPLPLQAFSEKSGRPPNHAMTEYPGMARLYDAEAAGDLEVLAAPDAAEATHAPPAAPPVGAVDPSLGAGAATARDAVVERPRRARRKAALAVGVILLLAGGGGGAWELTRPAPWEPVPAVVGRPLAGASTVTAADHLRLAVGSRTYSPTVAAGSVISQSPASGRLRRGSSISVVVSLGPQPVPVPNLAADAQQAAAQVLTALGLKVAVVPETSMTVPAGSVIGNVPDSGTLLPGQTVTLDVSTGKPQVAVPALSAAQSASETAAADALQAVGLVASPTSTYSDTVPKGEVVATSPAAGVSVPVGSTVTVEVSEGPHLVVVPNVSGQSVGAATNQLAAAGFGVSGVTGNPLGTVAGTVPAGGSEAHYGSAVQLVTG